jgi:hypothetical protein
LLSTFCFGNEARDRIFQRFSILDFQAFMVSADSTLTTPSTAAPPVESVKMEDWSQKAESRN